MNFQETLWDKVFSIYWISGTVISLFMLFAFASSWPFWVLFLSGGIFSVIWGITMFIEFDQAFKWNSKFSTWIAKKLNYKKH